MAAAPRSLRGRATEEQEVPGRSDEPKRKVSSFRCSCWRFPTLQPDRPAAGTAHGASNAPQPVDQMRTNLYAGCSSRTRLASVVAGSSTATRRLPLPTVTRTSSSAPMSFGLAPCLPTWRRPQQLRFYTESDRIEIVIDPKKAGSRLRNAGSADKSKRNRRKRVGGGKGTGSAASFVDFARIRVRGGDGGKGSLSTNTLATRSSSKHGRKFKPDGGHGGRGGDVVLVADPHMDSTTLAQHPHHVQADKGSNGGPQQRTGRNGKNRVVRVPCGVVVKRVLEYDSDDGYVDDNGDGPALDGISAVAETEELRRDIDGDNVEVEYEENRAKNGDDRQQVEYFFYDDDPNGDEETPVDGDETDRYDSSVPGRRRRSVFLADLDQPGSHVFVARGGRGGRGSCWYASDHGPLPDAHVQIENAQPEPGETHFLELELKLIADIGLVGFPNAGKSSLLSAMSRAEPKIAPYPFTTLVPILGCVEYRDGFRVRVADIPGLIQGASEGRGQGHDFLRHIERTKALLYMVDAAGVDGRDPVEDLMVLVDELDSYGDGNLLERRAIVVANKLDLFGSTASAETIIKERLLGIEEVAKDVGIQCEQGVLGISAGVTGEGLAELSRAMRNVVIESDRDRSNAEIMNDNVEVASI